jgi:hypothetical protein
LAISIEWHSEAGSRRELRVAAQRPAIPLPKGSRHEYDLLMLIEEIAEERYLRLSSLMYIVTDWQEKEVARNFASDFKRN